MEMKQINKVSIALKPNVYSTFRNLNNTVSNTLGEYVDNAVQSFLNHKTELFDLESQHKVTTKKRNAERYSDRIELQGFQSCFRLFVKPSQSPLKPNQDAATLLVRNHARNGDKRTRITKQGVKD